MARSVGKLLANAGVSQASWGAKRPATGARSKSWAKWVSSPTGAGKHRAIQAKGVKKIITLDPHA
jgi:hypothetical protein